MSTTSILQSGDIKYRAILRKHVVHWATTDPPYYLATDIPQLYSGDSSTVTSTTVTAATLTASAAAWDDDQHIGMWVEMLSGTAKGKFYRITANSATKITIDSDFWDLVSDGVLVGDTFKVSNILLGVTQFPRVQRSRGMLAASIALEIANDTGQYGAQLREMDLIECRHQILSASETGGEITVGYFFVDSIDDPGVGTISIQGRDAMKLGLLDRWTGVLQGDFIWEPVTATNRTTATPCAVMAGTDKVTSTNGDWYIFTHTKASGAASAALKRLAKTINWVQNPLPQLWRSANTNATVTTASDVDLPLQENKVVIYFGNGEVWINKTYYDGWSATTPNIKISYHRFATYFDNLTGAATGVSTTIVTDTNRAFTVDGLIGATLRFTSGTCRFRKFTISANTATTITLNTDVAALGATTGDIYEVVDCNAPHWRIVDMALACGFQARDSAKPFYIASPSALLLARRPSNVQRYNGTLYTNSVAVMTENTFLLESRIIETGTVTEITATILTNSAKSWSTDEHINRYIEITSGTANGNYYAITDSAATTLTSAGSTMSADGVAVGNTYQIVSYQGLPICGGAGHYVAIGGAAQFRNVKVKVLRAGVGSTLVVEYMSSTTSNWAAFTALTHRFVDGTSGMTVTGDQTLSWNVPPDWVPHNLSGTGGGNAWWIRIRETTGAPSTQPMIGDIRLADLTTAHQPEVVEVDDNRKHFEVLETYREKADVPENYLWRVNRNGQLSIGTVEQASGATYTMDTFTSMVRENSDANLYTSVRYRGTSFSRANLCQDDGTGINTVVITDLNAAAKTSDSAANINVLIDGSNQPVGVQNSNGKYKWQNLLYDGDLFKVDLGAQQTGIDEIVVYFYATPSGYWAGNAQPFYASQLFMIHTSDDDVTYAPIEKVVNCYTWFPAGLYSGWVHGWNATFATNLVASGGKGVFRVTSRTAGNWDAEFRYLKFRNVGCGYRNTPYLYEIEVYGNKELIATKTIGTDKPFDTTEWVNLKRRLRNRTYILPSPDEGAVTTQSVEERALLLLREVSRQYDTLQISGIRPDADLYDTVALSRKPLGILSKNFFLEDMTMGPQGNISGTLVAYR